MLVTIITPTTPRRALFMGKLVQMVAAQDYPHIEHLIDDGEGKIGAKRNRLCERAKGEIILHMDSDDVYMPDWVSKSVAALGDADITGLTSMYFIQQDTGEVYLYTYPHEDYVPGATMCYKKEYWQRNPFMDIQVSEDAKFIFGRGAKVKPHKYIGGFLSILHEGNTSPKNLTHRNWRKLGEDEAAEIRRAFSSYNPVACSDPL